MTKAGLASFIWLWLGSGFAGYVIGGWIGRPWAGLLFGAGLMLGPVCLNTIMPRRTNEETVT